MGALNDGIGGNDQVVVGMKRCYSRVITDSQFNVGTINPLVREEPVNQLKFIHLLALKRAPWDQLIEAWPPLCRE